MSVDIKRTFYTWSDTLPLAAGATVSEEGQALEAVLEDGMEKVKPASGSGTVCGFALYRQKVFSTDAKVETLVVPSAAPYEIELSKGQLIDGQLLVVVGGSALEKVSGTPAAGEYKADLVHGKLTFHSSAAGKAATVTYRYNMTVKEAQEKFYEAPANHPDANFFAQVGVGKGKGRLFTLNYDASVDWSSATPSAKADGLIGEGGAAIPNARVVHVPSAADPYLGIEFLL